jgi:hypothetical protein
MRDTEKEFSLFKGVSNAEDEKQTPFDCFRNAINYNYPDDGVLGMQKILMPNQIIQLDANYPVDGETEYRYLDGSNVLQTEYIAVQNGKIWKTNLSNTKTALKTGLTAGLASFAVFNDKLFIANGKNYINIYYGSLGIISEMGAPAAVGLATAGNVNVGAHYYAMSYVTAGGEEVLGSVSNTVTIASSAKQVTLHLPVGYSGVVSRNIYRTEAGGTALKLLASVSDNTTLTYTDNISDASLTTAIPATNNELPKPYFLAVAGQRLYGVKVDKYPTQVFSTGANNEVIDAANFIDVANYGNDNTPVSAVGIDFSKVFIATGKNWYMLDPSQTIVGETSVIPLRINVGCKSGYTVRNVPSFGDFPGGLMFVSTLNDVRIIHGQDEIVAPTTVSNITTQNWAQNIRGDLFNALKTPTYIYAEFFENKYHLIVDSTRYVFDIRTMGWTYHRIITASYQSLPRVMAVLNNKLYNGQPDGWIEQEYINVQYRSEDVTATIESPAIEVSRLYKWAQKFVFWFRAGVTSTMSISITLDDNSQFPSTGTFTLTGAAFNSTYFNPTYFQAGISTMDYRVFNIAAPCRWVKYVLTNTAGNIAFKAFSIVGQGLLNKENE